MISYCGNSERIKFDNNSIMCSCKFASLGAIASFWANILFQDTIQGQSCPCSSQIAN